MATICLICGDKGFDVAMDTCHECQDYSCHRYCRRVQPKDLSEDEPWLCEDCDPDFTNVCNFESSSSPTSEKVSTSSEPGKEQIQKCRSGFEKNDSDSLSSSESRGKDKNEQKLKKRRRLFLEEEEEDLEEEKLEASQLCSQPKSPRSLVVESEEPKKSDCDTGLKKQRRLVIEDDEDRPLEASGVECSNSSQQKLVRKKFDCNEPQSDLRNKPEKLGCEVPKAREKCDNDENLQKQVTTDHSNDVAQSEKQSNKDQKLEEQQRMITSRVSVSRAKSSNISEKKYQKPKKRKLILDEDDDDEPIGTNAKTKVQSGSEEKEANKTSEPKKLNPIESRDKDQNGSVLAVSDIKHSNISRHIAASSPEEKITGSLKSPRVSVSDRQGSASNFPREETIRGSSEPWRRERCCKDQKFGYRNRPLGTYGKNQRPRNRHHRRLVEDEEADYDRKRSGFIYRTPVWRGILSIRDIESRTIDRFSIAAHLSTLANNKAGDVAQMLPNCVFLDTFSRSQLWPNSFHETGPSSHHIALYFFSVERSYMFERFIDHMFEKDLALIAVFENVELVVFTSYVLPMNCQTIESKYFLWGGFRTRMASSLTNRLRCQQLCNVGDGRRV